MYAQPVHADLEANIGKVVFPDFLPKALEQLKPAPQAKMVGSGLDTVQRAVHELRKGVSATKLVVTLQEATKAL